MITMAVMAVIFIMVVMAITFVMAIMAVIPVITIMTLGVMVCITLIAAMSAFSVEALAAALPEPNCSDNCSDKMGCNGPNGYNGFLDRKRLFAGLIRQIVTYLPD